MLLAGVILLGVVIAETDLERAALLMRELGLSGIGLVLAIYFAGFVVLTGSWLVTLPSVAISSRWLYRLWKVLMVGSALDSVTPLAGIGGEPVKAAMLKRLYGIAYREGVSSLVLTRMTDLIAQVIFISIGFALMFGEEPFPEGFRWAAGAGLVAFSLAIGLFFLAQRKRGFSWLRGRLEGGWLNRILGARAQQALTALKDVEDRLVGFYWGERARFGASVALAFADWMASAVATYLAIRLLGFTIGFGDALAIEAFVVLVRSVLFFVPADIGTQDAALVLVCEAVTGSAPLGLALAVLRRIRDIGFIAWGLGIGWAHSLGPRSMARAALREKQEAASEVRAEGP